MALRLPVEADIIVTIAQLTTPAKDGTLTSFAKIPRGALESPSQHSELDDTRAALSWPTKREAVLVLSRLIAQEILAGTVPQLEGAEAIWRLSIEVETPFPELSTFVYATLEADGRPEMRGNFEEGIVEAAREIVNA